MLKNECVGSMKCHKHLILHSELTTTSHEHSHNRWTHCYRFSLTCSSSAASEHRMCVNSRQSKVETSHVTLDTVTLKKQQTAP